jgi:hypothetical protein
MYALAIGAAGSILASAVLAAFSKDSQIGTMLLYGGLLLTCAELVMVHKSINTLRSMGVVRWEPSMSTGTTTADAIRLSQRSLCFLGIAATKWLADPSLLRAMLLRHATNGGHARFLLLDPDSDACAEFEMIKNRSPGSLAKTIRANIQALRALQAERFRIEIRVYTEIPRFRLAVIDDTSILMGLYSFVSESGDDTPQIVFSSKPRMWSFYYGVNAFYTAQWERAKSVAQTATDGVGL